MVGNNKKNNFIIMKKENIMYQSILENEMLKEKTLTELKIIIPPEQYRKAESLLFKIPMEYYIDFINMLKCGITPQDAFDLLKDTNEF